jgi:hypothetical protein
MLLRLDPAVHDALSRWAADELRSTNAQIEFLLRRALAEAGRLPGHARRMRGRGRPPAAEREDHADATGAGTGEEDARGADATGADATGAGTGHEDASTHQGADRGGAGGLMEGVRAGGTREVAAHPDR